ncbi:MAG: DUF4173 domain-containing protein [Clostridiales Family XIII bacterium]|nr:DUF4173 domain-containing protein [Clostridiales Family XIII bacterium]
MNENLDSKTTPDAMNPAASNSHYTEASPAPRVANGPGPQIAGGYEQQTGSSGQQANGPGRQISNPYYAASHRRREWGFAPKDTLFAVLMFVLGMLFWDWIFVSDSLGVSVTAFFVTAVAMTGIYLRSLGFKQNSRSIPALAILLAGSLPFALYDTTDICFFLLLFDFAMALVWIMNTCGTSVSNRLSGYILPDIISQAFIVSFTNFPGPFKALAYGAKNKRGSKRGLYAFIGILLSIPVIAGVVALLMSADMGFAKVMEDIAYAINLESIGHYLVELLVGIPVACYIFGNVFGNGHGRYSDTFTKKGIDASLARMHRIPLVAIHAPLIVLTGIYILFFVAMGAYLFSAFSSDLPSAYTYAEYARRGFFELCGVAAINLAVIIFVYLFARRSAGEYPKSIRILTAVISSMTILLIATAASKMLLYVRTYGLTQLRVYTLWFMLLLVCVFAVVVIWHVRPFNAGKPIAILFAALMLCLFFGNTDGLIAKYNYEKYMAGALEEIDTESLSYLSDAAVPYLRDLAKDAPDASVQIGAKEALVLHENYEYGIWEDTDSFPTWRSWNLQSVLVSKKATILRR